MDLSLLVIEEDSCHSITTQIINRPYIVPLSSHATKKAMPQVGRFERGSDRRDRGDILVHDPARPVPRSIRRVGASTEGYFFRNSNFLKIPLSSRCVCIRWDFGLGHSFPRRQDMPHEPGRGFLWQARMEFGSVQQGCNVLWMGL
jgi:hypothetical protein